MNYPFERSVYLGLGLLNGHFCYDLVVHWPQGLHGIVQPHSLQAASVGLAGCKLPGVPVQLGLCNAYPLIVWPLRPLGSPWKHI
jgi:hypothetical protein